MERSFDAAWRKEALGGNVEAVSKLARWAVGPLFRFCYYRLGQDEHLCEDVVQETLLHDVPDPDQEP